MYSISSSVVATCIHQVKDALVYRLGLLQEKTQSELTELRTLTEQLEALKESNEEDLVSLRSSLEKERKDRKQVLVYGHSLPIIHAMFLCLNSVCSANFWFFCFTKSLMHLLLTCVAYFRSLYLTWGWRGVYGFALVPPSCPSDFCLAHNSKSTTARVMKLY